MIEAAYGDVLDRRRRNWRFLTWPMLEMLVRAENVALAALPGLPRFPRQTLNRLLDAANEGPTDGLRPTHGG